MARPRIRQLDVLRAVAILLVIGRHPAVHVPDAGRLTTLAVLWHRVGWTGVDLFFVLSGFLIGGLLLSELSSQGRLDVRRFLVRRAFKIWPSYYAYLAFAGLALAARGAWPWLAGASSAGAGLWPNLLHAQNYWATFRPHTWSLAVEEHFYLLLPLVLAVLPARVIPPLALALAGMCLWLRLVTPGPPDADWMCYLTPTHLRVDSLAFGVLLAYLADRRPALWGWLGQRRVPLLMLGLVLVWPMMLFRLFADPIVFRAGFTLLYLGYGCLLVAIVHAPGRWFTGRLGRGLAWLGAGSYPIYLWHADVGLFLARLSERYQPLASLPPELRWGLGMAMYLAVAVAVGLLMGRLIERPALAVRDRLFPARASVPPVAAPAAEPEPAERPAAPERVGRLTGLS